MGHMVMIAGAITGCVLAAGVAGFCSLMFVQAVINHDEAGDGNE